MKTIILMATYNGEKYLEQQLDSIITQTYSDWILLIRDDGSKDKTVTIINDYCKVDSRIHLLKDDKGNVGPLKNFELLLCSVSGYDIILFSDQDDIWGESKIEQTIKLFTKDSSEPEMVYTNFTHWDEKKNKEFLAYEMINRLNEKNLLIQNWIYGCTMGINSNLLEICKKIPIEAKNHDSWIANVAACYGKITYSSETTIRHRIHDSNVTTTNKNKLIYNVHYFIKSLKKRHEYLNQKKVMVEQLIKLGEKLDKKSMELEIFEEILKTRGIGSVKLMRENRYEAVTKMQTLLFLLMVI